MRYALFAVAFSGCGPAVIVHDYPKLGFRIIQTTQERVHKKCGDDAEACAISVRGSYGIPCEIWAYRAEDLTHELRHCSGGSEVEAQADNW